jgi:tetratricopeptide (TPR) repeat protein
MYAEGEYLGALYFGTEAEALAESKASWITNAPASAETWSPTPASEEKSGAEKTSRSTAGSMSLSPDWESLTQQSGHPNHEPETANVPISPATGLPALAPADKNDWQQILQDAKNLMTQGRYEESLQRYIWYHKHEPESGDAYQNVVRITSAISDWMELGRHYPKARQALIDIRNQETRQLKEGRGYADLFTDVQAINRELQEEDATYALYQTIREKDPQLAAECYFWVEGLLVSKGEYQWCYDHMGNPEFRFESIQRGYEGEISSQERMAETQERAKKMIAEMNQKHGWTNAPAYSPPDTSAMIRKSAADRFVGQTRQLIEILVATGHQADAEKIRDQAVAVLDDGRLKSVVTDAEQRIAQRSNAAPEK